MKNSKQSDKKYFNKKNVVIIGATGGLGQAYTDMFIEEGANIYLAIHSIEKLTAIHQKYGKHVKAGILDLEDMSSVEKFAKTVKQDFGSVDYVINATGYDVRKDLQSHSANEILKSININLTGAVGITRYFLPLLNDKKESTIVHMGGFIDGGLAFPYYSVDVASRSGIYAFCESMNRELKQEGKQCYITYCCPNPANTQAELPYHAVWKEMKTKISTVEEVAYFLKKTLEKRKKVSIMGGALQSGFAKFNHVSVRLSNLLLMNNYSKILKKHFGPPQENSDSTKERELEKLNNSQNAEPKKPHTACLAAALILFSFISYIAIALLPCMTISNSCKVLLFTLINAISWGTFFLGTLLGGKEVLRKLVHK